MTGYKAYSRMAEKLKAGGPDSWGNDELETYYRTVGFALYLAGEFYKYEHGKAPADPLDLVRLEYLDTWPEDPLNGWSALPLLKAGEPARPGGLRWSVDPSATKSFTVEVMGIEDPAQPLFTVTAPDETYYERLARRRGVTLDRIEAGLTERYPDRSMFPARNADAAAPDLTIAPAAE